MPRPTRRGRPPRSARWTTPRCAISSCTCTACSIPRPRARNPHSETFAQVSAKRRVAAGGVAAPWLVVHGGLGTSHPPEGGVLDAAAEPRRTKSGKAHPPERARDLLRRFANDWMWPQRRAIGLALCWTGALAASTAGYPAIIKWSFDSLMTPNSGVLPLVLVAVVAVTACRGLFLYLHQTTATRVVTR